LKPLIQYSDKIVFLHKHKKCEGYVRPMYVRRYACVYALWMYVWTYVWKVRAGIKREGLVTQYNVIW